MSEANQNECMVMPLMLPYGREREYLDAPKSVPFSMLDEKMADQIHFQTLKRLSERGGLAPSEMLALMEGKNLFTDSVDGVRLWKMEQSLAIVMIKQRLGA